MRRGLPVSAFANRAEAWHRAPSRVAFGLDVSDRGVRRLLPRVTEARPGFDLAIVQPARMRQVNLCKAAPSATFALLRSFFCEQLEGTIMHRLTLDVLLSALLTMPAVGFAAPKASVAIYEVTFQRTWSEATHPVAWPGTAAHFTGAIGATHNGKYAMFAAGGIATPGLEVLSQTGSSSPFDSELEAPNRKRFVGPIF